MARELKQYAREVINHARARWVAGDSQRQIVADLGVPRSTLQGWLEGYQRGKGQPVELSEEARQVGHVVHPAPKAGNSALPNVLEPTPRNPLQDWPELRQAPAIPMPDIDQLAARLLVGSANALASIQRLVGLEDWLKGQDASALASLYRVIADKQIRILEAVQRGNLERDDDQAQDGS